MMSEDHVRYFWFGIRTGPRPTGIPDRIQYSYSGGFRLTVENPGYVEAASSLRSFYQT